jgi:hypothetical protein
MSARSRERARSLAAHLKAKGVTRTTGQCPMGCGYGVPVGGGPLLVHLTRCKGKKRRYKV